MSQIESINRYPLSGAQADPLEESLLNLNGIVGDRYFLLYRPEAKPEGSDRISQKQFPRLAQLAACYTRSSTAMQITFPDQAAIEVPLSDGLGGDWLVNEFGDATPVIDEWYWQSDYLSDFLGIQVRLGQKSPAWFRNEDGHYPKPAERSIAPLHIVSRASVAELQLRAGTTDFGAERFRPNLVVDTDEAPFSENEWVGRVLMVGRTAVQIHRGTKRCPIPGYDQKTGENKKDVPKLYRDLPKSAGDNKPLFGVYGYPLLRLGENEVICVGDRIEIQ